MSIKPVNNTYKKSKMLGENKLIHKFLVCKFRLDS